MDNLPIFISLFFLTTTAATVYLFYRASHFSRITLLVIVAWLAVVAFLSIREFFLVTDTTPPRFLLLVGPPVLLIIGLFATAKGRRFINGLDLKMLTLLHVVRIPVEITLFYLFVYKLVPEVMTFEGRNLDIVSGITALLVYYFGCVKNMLGKRILIVWNVVCLLLLFNVVTHAILAAPTNFQQIAFDQPNIGVLYFPFVWLPACIVPLVFFSHLASLYILEKPSQIRIRKELQTGVEPLPANLRL